jgi:hypothetical protein
VRLSRRDASQNIVESRLDLLVRGVDVVELERKR